MDEEQQIGSLSCRQTSAKRKSCLQNLDMDAMFSILEQEKPNQREQIKIRADLVTKYFPEDFTPKQKTDLIEKLLKEWYDKQKHEKKQSPDRMGKARYSRMMDSGYEQRRIFILKQCETYRSWMEFL